MCHWFLYKDRTFFTIEKKKKTRSGCLTAMIAAVRTQVAAPAPKRVKKKLLLYLPISQLSKIMGKSTHTQMVNLAWVSVYTSTGCLTLCLRVFSFHVWVFCLFYIGLVILFLGSVLLCKANWWRTHYHSVFVSISAGIINSGTMSGLSFRIL